MFFPFVDRQNIENRSILESILPTIKQSIAAKNGIVLDDQTQYKIVRANGDEIKVQCITADGKEFEVEMKQSLSTDYERDESGDLKIFSCSKCPKTFSRRGKLINHERDHNAKSTGQECPYCQKWFPSNSTLTRHIRVHTGEKPFKCKVCNRSFIQKEILKRHLMTHSGERPFRCHHCPKSFILKEALRQHINRNHTENPTPEMHNCPFCPKVCARVLAVIVWFFTIIFIFLIFLFLFLPFSHSAIRLVWAVIYSYMPVEHLHAIIVIKNSMTRAHLNGTPSRFTMLLHRIRRANTSIVTYRLYARNISLKHSYFGFSVWQSSLIVVHFALCLPERLSFKLNDLPFFHSSDFIDTSNIKCNSN